MIVLRRSIERGVRHPVLGPLCLIVLAFLMTFTVIHGAHDQMHEGGGEIIVCIAIILTAIAAVIVPRPQVFRAAAIFAPRAPLVPVVLA